MDIEQFGAVCVAEGVCFSVYSEAVDRVFLVLLKDGKVCEYLMNRQGNIWSVTVRDAGPGTLYAYRVEMKEGDCRKPTSDWLLDPYAREIVGNYSVEVQSQSVHGLMSRVVDENDFDWENDRGLVVPNEKTIIYETHVKGATKTHPMVDPEIRGTYLGLVSPAFLRHLKGLGVTTVSLMPIHRYIDEDRLIGKSLKNYWGYNTVGYFAPETRYAISEIKARDEFREMVKGLHSAGFEVILDVVYNHTAETDEYGPTLHFRGIDNLTYYRVCGEKGQKYENFTGCGNVFDLRSPAALKLVLDSMRYWVQTMHVDGFRFDLASTLARDSEFLTSVAEDPILSRVKLIAEPWDMGPYGYQVGHFPSPWSEWNDKYRDDVRAFWLTHSVGPGALADRLSGSSALFSHNERLPFSSVNFITAHDGFTLRDCVTYCEKHNEANGEENRDGHNANFSVNCGVEGETDNTAIVQKRQRLVRAMLSTLMLSKGTPMLTCGDELYRTQGGNNNAYCQDNETTWLNWKTGDLTLTQFIGDLIRLRQAIPQLQNAKWYTGKLDQRLTRDVTWLNRVGKPMQGEDWSGADTLTVRLSGEENVPDVLMLFTRSDDRVTFTLPPGGWALQMVSSEARLRAPRVVHKKLVLQGPAVAVLVECPTKKRLSGVILHVTSLPGPMGCGDFGKEAYAFVDWLHAASQGLWQVLPLTVTGLGNSPYMGASVFAGNELLIDCRDFVRRGWLDASDIGENTFDEKSVQYDAVREYRYVLLRKAADRFFSQRNQKLFESFCEREASWLNDYAYFRTIERIEDGKDWQLWPTNLKNHEKEALDGIAAQQEEEFRFWKFVQWCFAYQWDALRQYANQQGVRVIGDMPIFVAQQSADVWAHQALFDLDEKGYPKSVAGVPPDYFSKTGQLWGNPLYLWDNHRKENYAWWTSRMKRAAALYDVIRVDHFRGFEAFWRIPAESKTAMEGHWEKGPGREVFDAFKKENIKVDFIAEDLGVITEEVNALRESLQFPGMRVLQFAFDGDPTNPHLVVNMSVRSSFYTGTHDNDTCRGWFESLTEKERTDLLDLFKCTNGSISRACIDLVYASKAMIAMTTVQDVLGLGSADRMNRPGDATGAWRWRMLPNALTREHARWLSIVTRKTHRNGY